MVPSSPPQLRLAAAASLLARPPSWLRSAEPWVGILAIAAATLLAFRLTDRFVVAIVVLLAGMALAAWHWSRLLAASRDALLRSERAGAALEQALRRSQQIEALGRLTIGVAHDFNNHLTVIGSNVEMLHRRLDRAQGRLLHHTDAALQAVQRAAALTSLLLSFASARRQPDPEAVDTFLLLRRVAELLRRTLGGRISLDLRPPEEAWFIWTDLHTMENALLSLAVNARDRIGDGDTLTIAVANVHLATHPGVPPGDYIRITIGDQPTDPADWRSADDPACADLALACASMRDAGGYLMRPDPPSALLPLLVLLPRHAPPPLACVVAPRDPAAPPTILVVEDDAAQRGHCVRILRRLDYTVLEAPDAMEAFRLIADHGGIDLLFTDIVLPGGVSGRALAEAARNADPTMRVLFTTGHDDLELPGLAATASLRKPFTAAQLATAVQTMLFDRPPNQSPASEARDQATG